MRSKYEVGQSVWFFDPNAEEIVCQPVEVVFANADGVFYQLEKATLPEKQVYGAKEQCRAHFLTLFGN